MLNWQAYLFFKLTYFMRLNLFLEAVKCTSIVKKITNILNTLILKKKQKKFKITSITKTLSKTISK